MLGTELTIGVTVSCVSSSSTTETGSVYRILNMRSHANTYFTRSISLAVWSFALTSRVPNSSS
jgi:hypothetical protein